MPEPLGTGEFGRYRVLRQLGRGGMGEVYLAHDDALRRQVAIKVIDESRVAGEDARRRILHEARASAAIDHPCVCTVYETGVTTEGRPFIVMQFVEGEPLSAVLTRGALPARRALTLCLEIAGALDAAHSQGVIHRDLKPSNILITPEGHPKLVDFGIATVVATVAAGDAETTSALYEPGFSGTPGYMSPEQVQGEVVDGRSDLFSLGAVLFECLTGTRAFTASTWIETTAKVLHVNPPPVSSLRPGLTEQHDLLGARLLAKDPADRFQSAQEVEGALRLLTSETGSGSEPERQPSPLPPARVRWWQRPVVVASLLAALGIVVLLAVWRGWSPGLPPPPPEAEVWYRRATEQIREGAYQSAVRALNQAIEIFPDYALAYARRAEAQAELDNDSAARDSLLRMSTVVRNEAWLPADEQTRVRAVSALVLRDVDRAVQEYQRLVTAHPNDAGAWLDLGRAQEAAGRLGDARTAYAHAVEHDPQSAAAHLRLGSVESLDSASTSALASFDRAETLYRAASNREGETEVLLRRGALFDAAGDFRAARAQLERALSLATNGGAVFQQIRARLTLSIVTASEGRLAESEAAAASAVDDAKEAGFETLAADGLIDLAATLFESRRPQEAEAHLAHALALAGLQHAVRTTARATVQLAAIQQSTGRPEQALATLDSVVRSLEKNQYRRLELTAGSVAARAYTALDDLQRAREVSKSTLAVAESVKDEAQVALAASSLANAEAALGELPGAELHRRRAEAVHRQQAYSAILPFDLANHADVLLRLGRRDDALKDLDELANGIHEGHQAYTGHARREQFLRAMADVTAGRCATALAALQKLSAAGASDTTGTLAPAVAGYCAGRSPRSFDDRLAADRAAGPVLARERAYWRAAAALKAGNVETALGEARTGLSLLGDQPNDELRWRLAAVGALAAARVGDQAAVAELEPTFRTAFDRLRSRWGGDFVMYGDRSDLSALHQRARTLAPQPSETQR